MQTYYSQDILRVTIVPIPSECNEHGPPCHYNHTPTNSSVPNANIRQNIR